MDRNTIKDKTLANLLKEKDALMMEAISKKDITAIMTLLGYFYWKGKKQGLADGVIITRKYLG